MKDSEPESFVLRIPCLKSVHMRHAVAVAPLARCLDTSPDIFASGFQVILVFFFEIVVQNATQGGR